MNTRQVRFQGSLLLLNTSRPTNDAVLIEAVISAVLDAFETFGSCIERFMNTRVTCQQSYTSRYDLCCNLGAFLLECRHACF